MTSLATLAEIEKALAAYVPLAKEITGKDLTLERMVPLMAALGNPQEHLRIIHIAGTSGKTSTAYYIASMLSHMGKKTGLTVSPHVDSVLERLQINMKTLDEAEFGHALAECIDIVESSNIKPTYFELLVGFAYWYFVKSKVDFAVVETGMGGLQDGTNIAQDMEKLCVITDIGLDHMQVLGNTVSQIASQKAGIIHQGNTAVMYRQSDEIMKVFIEHCESVGAKLVIIEPGAVIAAETLPAMYNDLPDFQQRNWLLAVCALNHTDIPILSDEALIASLQLQVPGRMDEVRVNSKTIIMDGAHNEQKTEAFVLSFTRHNPGKRVPVLLSLKQGKEFAAVLPLLKPITSTLILTMFSGSQDLPAAPIDPNELAAAAERFGFKDVVVESDQDKAYQLLLGARSDIAIITGSFYLIGQLRQKHKELKVERS